MKCIKLNPVEYYFVADKASFIVNLYKVIRISKVFCKLKHALGIFLLNRVQFVVGSTGVVIIILFYTLFKGKYNRLKTA